MEGSVGDYHCGSHPIRLQDSLIFNISGMNQMISVFLHEVIYQGKLAFETITFGWV